MEIPEDAFSATMAITLANETVATCREGMNAYRAPLREYSREVMALGYDRSTVSLGIASVRAALLSKLMLVENGLESAVHYNPKMVRLLKDELHSVKNDLEMILFSAEIEILEAPAIESQLLYQNGGNSHA